MRMTSLLLVPLVAAVALTGCRTRGAGGSGDVTESELRAENQRLEQQVANDQRRIRELQDQLAMAREGLNGGPTLGQTMGIAGDDIEGFERTASGGVALPEDFAFAKGSAELNEDGQKAIERLAARLNEGANAGKNVIVKGFTDDTPVSRSTTKEKYVDNWGLSAARAASVLRALEKAGVTSERLHGAFRGQLDPRVQGGEDKGKNRRVEIFLNS
jgi:flagellar motor protein MotB